ncbi:hypothetical protein SEUCBS139899_001332 [Sporothrix eucalyptigena]|uniref:Uncharacterized protein n=1 Tax=Sporothrix eucalyptigena TaxID=1812306 RepID=A0ABP0CHZ8_9PEZI
MNTPPPPYRGHAWRPGFARQVPWAALGSIVAFMACCIGIGVTLSSSQGKPVATWPSKEHTFSVSALLSLLVSIANVCLSASLAKAYEISWWLKAINGAELRRLKFDLNVQSNIMAILSRGFTLNRFTIAASIALAVTVLDGPLIQKASTIVSKSSGPIGANVTAAVLNGYLPDDWSGYGDAPDLLTPQFTNVSLAYNNRDAIVLDVDGCNDANTTCTLNYPGLGFDVECTETTVAYDFGNLAAATSNNNVTTFKINMAYGQNENAAEFLSIRTTATYKPNNTCKGDLTKRSCSLRLSTVNYPLTLSNGVATMASWDESRNDTIALANVSDTEAYGILYTGSYAAGGFQSMLGGVYLVLDNMYAGNASLKIATMTEAPYIVYGYGTSTSNYLTSSLSTYGNCSMTWKDPTTDIVNTARELMLRSVITYASQNPSKTITTSFVAQRTTVAATYESAYKYLAAAVATMTLEMFIILFLLHGWYRLGRHVSLDAFEIARALGAPLLQGGSSNSVIDASLMPIERIPLRYGEVLPQQPGHNASPGSFGDAGLLLPGHEGAVNLDRGAFSLKGDGYAMVNVTDDQQPQVRRLGLVEAQRAARIEKDVLY